MSTLPADARCAQHPEAVARELCSRCGAFLCAACRQVRDKTFYCVACFGRPAPMSDRWVVRAFGLALAHPFLVVTLYTFGGWAALVACLGAPLLALLPVGLALLELRARQREEAPRRRRWMLVVALSLGLLEFVWGGWLAVRLLSVTARQYVTQQAAARSE